MKKQIASLTLAAALAVLAGCEEEVIKEETAESAIGSKHERAGKEKGTEGKEKLTITEKAFIAIPIPDKTKEEKEIEKANIEAVVKDVAKTFKFTSMKNIEMKERKENKNLYELRIKFSYEDEDAVRTASKKVPIYSDKLFRYLEDLPDVTYANLVWDVPPLSHLMKLQDRKSYASFYYRHEGNSYAIGGEELRK